MQGRDEFAEFNELDSAFDDSHIDLGKRGENAAARYLERRDYEILERNWRCKFGEVDIIAVDRCTEELVFVEVKTRRSLEAGIPEEAITPQKRRRLERLAMAYLCDTNLDVEMHLRFDAIGICVTHDHRAVLRHHRACSDEC